MKAVVIREFGPPEAMRLEDVPAPVPGRGEVLLRVHAVSVNRTLDLAVRAGVFPKAFATLARNGRLITAGAHGGGTVPLDVKRLYLNAITVIGSVGRITSDDLEVSLRAAADGRYRVLIDRVLPLSEAVRAHHIVAERSGIGKVVLQPSA